MPYQHKHRELRYEDGHVRCPCGLDQPVTQVGMANVKRALQVGCEGFEREKRAHGARQGEKRLSDGKRRAPTKDDVKGGGERKLAEVVRAADATRAERGAASLLAAWRTRTRGSSVPVGQANAQRGNKSGTRTRAKSVGTSTSRTSVRGGERANTVGTSTSRTSASGGGGQRRSDKRDLPTSSRSRKKTNGQDG